MQLLNRLGACFGHSTHPHAIADLPEEHGILSEVLSDRCDKKNYKGLDGLAQSPRDVKDGCLIHGSSVSPMAEASCSTDAMMEIMVSDEEEESYGLMIDDLPIEILEAIFVQLKETVLDCSHNAGKHGSRMTRGDVRTLISVSSVSRKWRTLAQRIFFTSPWDINLKSNTFTYQHPIQMFCTSPIGPKGSRSGLVKCYVKRHNVEETGGNLVISMYIGKPSSTKSSFMMSAIGRGRSSYHIYLENAHKATMQGFEPCARLECNLLCTSYSLKLSNAMSSSIEHTIKTQDSTCESAVCPTCSCDGKQEQRGLLSLQYRARMRGIMQPRRMEVSLPRGLHSMTPHVLHNKHPHWNEGLHCWCLNFKGRVKLASVKNFQLVHQEYENDLEGSIIMQFGKIGEDLFILDFNPTIMSPIQAFGTALSTFNGRVIGLMH